MQATITGPVLGVDTVVIVSGTRTQTRRVMKVQIDHEDVEWTQEPSPNPTIAMLPFEAVFYEEVDLNTTITVTGPILVRHTLPQSQAVAFTAQMARLNTRLLGALRKWINHYGYAAHQVALESAMKNFLADKLPLPTLYEQIQLEVFGPVNHPPLKMAKLQAEINAQLVKRWAVAKQSTLVMWFDEVETFEYQGDASSTETGPLQVIRLDGSSIDEYWQKWQAKTASK